MSGPRLRALLAATTRYAPPRHPAPCDLDLAGTELPPLDAPQLEADFATDLTAGYPSALGLQGDIAARLGVRSSRVLVTAGSDDALERACRVMLEPGRAAIVTDPTFEMLPRWIRLTGAACREVPWTGEGLPVEAMLTNVDPQTSLIAVVTPNNPTGAVASVADISAIARSALDAVVLVDLAYVEFADVDPSRELLSLPNVVVTRTLSKAWGLPGLRVGYAAGPQEVIAAMQRVAPPYPVAAPSIAAARRALSRDRVDMEQRVAQIRATRAALTRRLDELVMDPLPSHANFVCTAAPRADWLRDGLAGLGIAVRSLEAPQALRVRITCPPDACDAARLTTALGAVLDPEALLFDLDGVIADVSASYRATILSTADQFGARVTADDVRARKAAGNANDDWALTHELVTQQGVNATLDEVTAVFESTYQGSPGAPGYRSRETLIPDASLLRDLAARLPLAIVTGRPRADAERFLAEHAIDPCFRVVVCREDAPIKPDPAPVRLALQRLGVTRAWMIGDTPDDIRAARAAGVVPLSILAPGEPDASRDPLYAAGAGRVLTTLEELLSCLP